MNSFLSYFKVNTKSSLLGVVLVLILALELLTGGFWGFQEALAPTQPEAILTLSEIEAPTIDEVAAMVTAEEEACLTDAALPNGIWLVTLLIMTALLIWNFAMALLTKKKLEWLPETVYVALALLAWVVTDYCAVAPWFPVVLVKVSLIIFALYLYLFETYKESERL